MKNRNKSVLTFSLLLLVLILWQVISYHFLSGYVFRPHVLHTMSLPTTMKDLYVLDGAHSDCGNDDNIYKAVGITPEFIYQYIQISPDSLRIDSDLYMDSLHIANTYRNQYHLYITYPSHFMYSLFHPQAVVYEYLDQKENNVSLVHIAEYRWILFFWWKKQDRLGTTYICSKSVHID